MHAAAADDTHSLILQLAIMRQFDGANHPQLSTIYHWLEFVNASTTVLVTIKGSIMKNVLK